ncbi:MAG TPA: carboxypeptidase-like regulatory domain-containing protein, partial [Vicinamibacterales bacterium]
MRTRPLLAAAVSVLSIALAAGSVLARQEQGKPQVPVRPRDTGAPQTAAGSTATGLLAGMLVAADTGNPVRRASVSLASAETGMRRSVMTDEMGRFSFDKLPAGAFTLSANRAGYLDVTYGQRTPGSDRPGTPIQLAAGQRLENVSLRMPRTGVLTGVITDEFGDPSMGIQVQAWRWVKRSGERTLQSSGFATTDDRGIWRMPGLIPGEYIVGTMARETSETMYIDSLKLRDVEMAEARLFAATTALKDKLAFQFDAASNANASKIGYASIYYPGTLQSAAATAVTLGISEERSGVDLRLQAVPLATVSGSVIGPDGGLPPGGQVRLVETNAVIPGFKLYSSPIRNDGTFTINGVPPGQYTLLARTNSRVVMRLNGEATVELQAKSFEYAIDVAPARKAAVLSEAQAQANAGGPEQLWGQSEVSVDGRPLTNVVLQLQRGFDVSGSYAFDGTPPQPPDLS